MVARVVTEGKADAVLLQEILAIAGIEDVNVIDAGGKSSAKSLGTSFALSGRGPVAVVLDADTSDEGSILEQLTIFGDLQPRHLRDECKLFLAVPTLGKELFPNAYAPSPTPGLVRATAVDQLFGRPLISNLLAFLRAQPRRSKVDVTRMVRRKNAAPA